MSMCRMKPLISTIAIPSITVVAGIVKKRNTNMNIAAVAMTIMNVMIIAGVVISTAVVSRAMFAR